MSGSGTHWAYPATYAGLTLVALLPWWISGTWAAALGATGLAFLAFMAGFCLAVWMDGEA
jgi:hypothetical protein